MNSETRPLPVAPSMSPTLETAQIHGAKPLVDRRLLFISFTAVGIAAAASCIALVLVHLISFITNLAFYQRFSLEAVGPAGNQLGLFVIGVPVLGGLIVGLMARFGSKAIRGHGIPEAMEQVLHGESVIPARLTFLKPLSAAISIGTGGPFGAEGPIIASGGAFGSLVGQLIPTTAQERKTLLASGAAAGMTAIFGSPISAVFLAIELLIFEYRPRSFLPISLAAACAGTLRIILFGSAPAFTLHEVSPPTFSVVISYALLGAVLGIASVGVTKSVYWIEDLFEKLPLHWMWWPAIGGLFVGVIGYFFPNTMGVGYDNIDRILSGDLSTKAIAIFCLMKFISWAISLGTGTSGGTLAPLFTIGGGIGLIYGELVAKALPSFPIDLSVAALVGMAGMFTGASRAMIASIIFAFETTRQPWILLPLLAGCSVSYIISCLRMKNSIMTEKIVRRGITVPNEYEADPLSLITAEKVATKKVVTFKETDSVDFVRNVLSSIKPKLRFHSYPVLNQKGDPIGIFTLKDLFAYGYSFENPVSELFSHPVITVPNNVPLSQVRNIMVKERIGRLLVVDQKRNLSGIITRSDILQAYSMSLEAEFKSESKFRKRSDEIK